MFMNRKQIISHINRTFSPEIILRLKETFQAQLQVETRRSRNTAEKKGGESNISLWTIIIIIIGVIVVVV
jgi:hypothetical protein